MPKKVCKNVFYLVIRKTERKTNKNKIIEQNRVALNIKLKIIKFIKEINTYPINERAIALV